MRLPVSWASIYRDRSVIVPDDEQDSQEVFQYAARVAFTIAARHGREHEKGPVRPTGPPSGHKVFCLWPHCLQAYSARPWPHSAVTRLGAPHLVHFTSSRVLPRVIVTFRAIASLTKRSDSWRMASFDIAGARGFDTINPRLPTSRSVAYFSTHPNCFLSTPLCVERVAPPNRRGSRMGPVSDRAKPEAFRPFLM